MKTIYWAIVLILIPALVAAVDAWRRKTVGPIQRWWKNERMPLRLRRATLFLSERNISITHPVLLNGRIDQVFMDSKGVLWIVDTKYRTWPRYFESDIIQLSTYRLILMNQFSRPVSRRAYIRVVVETQGNRSIFYLRVKLYPERVVLRLLRTTGSSYDAA